MDKRTCMILMIIGGAFYIAGGVIASFIAGSLGAFVSGLTGSPEIAEKTQESINIILGTGLISGVMIIVGGILVNSENRKRRVVGGVLGIIGALIGIINTIAGLVIGLALTLAGAIGGLTYKERS